MPLGTFDEYMAGVGDIPVLLSCSTFLLEKYHTRLLKGGVDVSGEQHDISVT